MTLVYISRQSDKMSKLTMRNAYIEDYNYKLKSRINGQTKKRNKTSG